MVGGWGGGLAVQLTEAPLLYLGCAVGWWPEGVPDLSNELSQEDALLRGPAAIPCPPQPLCAWDSVESGAAFDGRILGILGRGH